jgi:hypothetical protein
MRRREEHAAPERGERSHQGLVGSHGAHREDDRRDCLSGIAQVGEVAVTGSTSAEEQRRGITQITRAMEQRDSVTQSVAANAEESASASEALSSQAEVIRSLVGQFAMSSAREARGNGLRSPAGMSRLPLTGAAHRSSHHQTREPAYAGV